jgi:hypothetical protein
MKFEITLDIETDTGSKVTAEDIRRYFNAMIEVAQEAVGADDQVIGEFFIVGAKAEQL